MNFKTSITWFAATTLVSATVFATSPQNPDAICKVDAKTIQSAFAVSKPGPQTPIMAKINPLAEQLKRIDKLSLFNHANLWSGMTLIQDDVLIKFKDIKTLVIVQDLAKGSKPVDHEMVQSSGLYDSKNVLMTKHEQITSKNSFTAKYTHTSTVVEPVKLTVTVAEKLLTDHILGRGVVITLESKDGSATAQLKCKDFAGGRFTFTEKK